MSKLRDALHKAKKSRKTAAPDAPAIKVERRARRATGKRAGNGAGRAAEGPRIQVDHAALRRAGVLAPQGQERRLADEYRQIKRPLLANAGGQSGLDLPRANVIMVTSPMPGDGKTFTCINLALSIAREKDWRVVLVDGDVATGYLSGLFGLGDATGLLDLLRIPDLALETCISETDVPGLSVLPAGTRDEEATELLASRRMDALARALGDIPRAIVLFDSPPLLVTTEATALGAHVGQIAVVVKAGHSTYQQVLSAIEKLDPEAAVGLILNQAELGRDSLAYGAYGYRRYGGDAAAEGTGGETDAAPATAITHGRPGL